jgi:hypothetical protein
MAKIKKAIFGIGVGKEEREARRDKREYNRSIRKENRQMYREDKASCRGGKCGGRAKGFIGYNKDGGKVKKGQNGVLEYKSPTGNTIKTDTTGYAAGKKRFPASFTGRKTGLYGRPEKNESTSYGTMNRKMAGRTIDASQGKPKKRIGMNTSGAKKAKKVIGKTGTKISKKK